MACQFKKIYIFQFEGGVSHLPLTDPAILAIPLTTKQWRNRLEAASEIGVKLNADLSTNCILLDVRNGMYSF